MSSLTPTYSFSEVLLPLKTVSQHEQEHDSRSTIRVYSGHQYKTTAKVAMGTIIGPVIPKIPIDHSNIRVVDLQFSRSIYSTYKNLSEELKKNTQSLKMMLSLNYPFYKLEINMLAV